MTVLLIFSLGLLAYALAGYPLALRLLSGRKGAKSEAFPPLSADFSALPPVSMLLSVYNEDTIIDRKLDNFLRLAYPRDRLELIVVSDGSTDTTDAIVRGRNEPGVLLLRQEGRLGKSSALNLAAQHARGDLLFFTDADSMLRPDCLARIARPFADPMVGLAGGRSLYLDEHGRETVGGLYRRYEEWIKEKEGRLAGIVGADGAVYAMRRELFTPLDPACINDFLHPIQVILAGSKAVAVPDALIAEAGVHEGSRAELARQTRIMAQSWLIALRYVPVLLRNRRWGFLWQFVSHKILRWLILPLLSLCAVSALATPGLIPALVLAGLAGLSAFSWLGARGRGGWGGKAAWLVMVQSLAAMRGLFSLTRGERFVTWTPKGQ